MKEYLKMNDVFDLTAMKPDKLSIKPSCVWSSYDDGVTPHDHAAHAINSHDELVAEVERLTLENEKLKRDNNLLIEDSMK